MYKLIGLPLHFLRACLSLAKKKEFLDIPKILLYFTMWTALSVPSLLSAVARHTIGQEISTQKILKGVTECHSPN